MPKLSYDPYDDAEKLGKYINLKTQSDGIRLFNPESKVKSAIEAATLARGDNPKTAVGDRLDFDVNALGEQKFYGGEYTRLQPSQESRNRVKAAMQDVSELADQYKREMRGTKDTSLRGKLREKIGMGHIKGIKKGGEVKAKGWGQARGVRAAKVY
jgi:hypothetical protein